MKKITTMLLSLSLVISAFSFYATTSFAAEPDTNINETVATEQEENQDISTPDKISEVVENGEDFTIDTPAPTATPDSETPQTNSPKFTSIKEFLTGSFKENFDKIKEFSEGKCPKCGNKIDVSVLHEENPKDYTIHCDKCDVYIDGKDASYVTANLMIHEILKDKDYTDEQIDTIVKYFVNVCPVCDEPLSQRDKTTTSESNGAQMTVTEHLGYCKKCGYDVEKDTPFVLDAMKDIVSGMLGLSMQQVAATDNFMDEHGKCKECGNPVKISHNGDETTYKCDECNYSITVDKNGNLLSFDMAGSFESNGDITDKESNDDDTYYVHPQEEGVIYSTNTDTDINPHTGDTITTSLAIIALLGISVGTIVFLRKKHS